MSFLGLGVFLVILFFIYKVSYWILAVQPPQEGVVLENPEVWLDVPGNRVEPLVIDLVPSKVSKEELR